MLRLNMSKLKNIKYLSISILLILAISVVIIIFKRSPSMKIDVWMTTVDGEKLLSQMESINFKKNSVEVEYTININEEKTYQTMDGFGASLTDSSAWLMHNKIDEDTRNELMTKLFERENGIGISFLRQPMGASDFALEVYSYNDMPKGEEDFDLEHFSIDYDKEDIIPLIKRALEINKDIKVMASPWSPPAWMKRAESMIGAYGGGLREECYGVYADYFVRFINAYKNEGIPIYAITIQNEPGYEPMQYPGMAMIAREQIEFIKNYLGPTFENNNIDTKIITYDHNWDNYLYPIQVLSDEEAAKYIAGSAWHSYGGKHDAMTKVYDLFPEKDIWFTEASGGDWVPLFRSAFLDQMMHIIRSPRNWSKTVVWWNIALDEDNGPSLLKKSTCRGLVKIEQSTGKVSYNLDYYTLGHISKFVYPGAYRIESNTYENEIENVAFKNPDGSKVLIVSNRKEQDVTFEVNTGENVFYYTIPSEGAITFKW